MLQRVLGAVLLFALLATTLGDSSPHALLTAGALTAMAVAAVLLRLCVQPVTGGAANRSPESISPDERCCRGSFRRQTHPRAPGRPLPRAPQTA